MTTATTTAHISKVRPIEDWHIEVALFGDGLEGQKFAAEHGGVVMVHNSGRTTVRIPLPELDRFEAAAQAAGFKTKSMKWSKGWYYYAPPAMAGTFTWGGEGWAYSLGDGRWLGYIWKVGCHPDRPWRGVVVDGGYEPRFDDNLCNLMWRKPAFRGPMPCDVVKAYDVRTWAKEMGLPVPCAYWQVEVIPVGEHPGENWTDAEPEHHFPEECPWIDGEIVSPLIAEDIAGMDAEELEKISPEWQVVVQWHDEEEPTNYWDTIEVRKPYGIE